MKVISRIRSLLANLLRKEKIDRELDNELRAYVEMATDEKIAAGLSASEARRSTLVDFGGIEQVKQAVRDNRAGTLLEIMGQDVRYGCRQLVRNPEPSKAGSMLSPASKGLASPATLLWRPTTRATASKSRASLS
jgi:hypothetical protein